VNMTDRYNTLTVVLERDVRDDDAAPLLQAIRLMRGVADVRGNVTDQAGFMAEARARREFQNRLWRALDDKGAT
jgi:hypothetical protein